MPKSEAKKSKEDVAPRDPLAGQEERGTPEEQGGADHAVYAHGEGTHASGICRGDENAFADRGVEPPDDVGDPEGRMTFEFSLVHVRDTLNAPPAPLLFLRL